MPPVGPCERTVSSPNAAAARATANAWARLETEFGLLTPVEVATILGVSRNRHAYVESLRQQGALECIELEGVCLYPGFQLDMGARRIHAWVAPLLKLATQHQRSPSDVFIWIVAPSTYFNGARPVDSLNNPALMLSVASRSWNIEW